MLGQLIGDLDEAYARMRRLVPALAAGPVDRARLSDAQRDAIGQYEALARATRDARRVGIPIQHGRPLG